MEKSTDDLSEEVMQDGCRIVGISGADLNLLAHYEIYNRKYFDATLPAMPVFWAKAIYLADRRRANGLYVCEETPTKRRYIVLDEKLSGMFPLERLCLLHEMVHVKIEPVHGHNGKFVAELKRVLDADGWEVMGCVDSFNP
jgi:ribosomal protein S18 acetylase RimI-like enzyme